MTKPTEDDLSANFLLATLRKADRNRLASDMMFFERKAGDVLQYAGEEVVHTWFPCGAALASFCVQTDQTGNSVEVAVVGREGAIGGIVSNGHVPSYSTVSVRSGGRFLRIKTSALELAKLDSIQLRHWFSRYSDCLLAQVFQTAACNATHTITQRTAKWLIASMDRTSDNEFQMTQEQLAELLGVGRTFVTRIVQRMRADGLIATRRGVFVVLDQVALQRLACGCTTSIEEHFDAVLHGIYPTE